MPPLRVAYLHGFLGSPAVWTGIGPPGARVLALPGHGGGPVRATWDANVDAVAGAIGRCDLVVGYSLGGRVALGLLATGWIGRAILISTTPGIDDAERPARRASDAAWAARFRADGVGPTVDAWEAQPLFATQTRADADARAARHQRRLGLDAEQLARSLEAMGLAEMPDYRGEVDARCTLIVGADDAKYVAIARALPARTLVIDGCGHDPTLERPRVLADLLDGELRA